MEGSSYKRRCFARSGLQEAKAEGKIRAKTMEFRYRRRYSLTSNDPRFLDTTREEMLTDLFAHHYFENPKEADEVIDEEFDAEEVMRHLEQNDGNWEALK
jgi:hypothetical protein